MSAIRFAIAAALVLSQVASAQESAGNTTAPEVFPVISANSSYSSQIVGLDVYNDSKQDVGQIQDIVMSKDGHTQAYVLSVVGVLGMFERYVAVNPSVVTVSYSESDKAWHAFMKISPEQLLAAPVFQYSGRLKGCINILQ
jgi:PRC-barrel domain protein